MSVAAHTRPRGDTGAPLPLSAARTRPGGSLGQRGDRMAPLRWGVRDHPGVVLGDGRQRGQARCVDRSASRGGFYLDIEKTAGSPKTGSFWRSPVPSFVLTV